jgi:demethylmenaquinone methyltransferase/2-methoxy-6-polyprenyl-1,4-benzoquinol methylase
VHYQLADLFSWEPAQQYDLVFFANWLSHVPPDALDAFLDKVVRAVRPGGKLAIVDQYAPTPEDRSAAQGELYAERTLADGRTFTIVKVFYDLSQLQDRLAKRGFAAVVHTLDDIGFLLVGTRNEEPVC